MHGGLVCVMCTAVKHPWEVEAINSGSTNISLTTEHFKSYSNP